MSDILTRRFTWRFLHAVVSRYFMMKLSGHYVPKHEKREECKYEIGQNI